ncbi:unnamed protein product [Rotaria magnacalcarata]|uniref:small monomeric GTPase n=1 Tax=Rotaria magnacalcarata TaxID=392030 RepID=A0A819TZL7_9BILA|nr:unnamed protein product [Rotaria magnacalcarata]CAF4095170.1 unnamed protein product [Rotaria magnacalcarata]
MKFTTFNLAQRHAQSDHLWKDYISSADAIVFLVDAADSIRFARAKAELDNLLKDEKIFNVPIVILGSKSDSQNAVDEKRFRAALDLSETMEQHNDGRNLRNLQVYMCNMNDIGTFGCAFRYIGRFLKEI